LPEKTIDAKILANEAQELNLILNRIFRSSQ